MPNLRTRLAPAAIALLALFAIAPAAAQPADALGVPGPVAFMDEDYALAWADGSGEGYFIQEYLPEGQTVETYEAMFMIEAVAAGVTVEAAVADRIGMLEARKGSDPVVNHQVLRNEQTGEILLDFLISETSADPVVVEWNAYRYVPQGDGVVLYAISRRGYGNDRATAFLQGLKDWRMDAINALAQMQVPAITLP